MSDALGLSAQSTLSDNITRIRIQGGSLSSPEVIARLVEVTREGGFSRRDLDDARAIHANLAERDDPDAGVLSGLVDEIVEAREGQSVFDRISALQEVFRHNSLPSLAWREDPLPGNPERQLAKIEDLQRELARRAHEAREKWTEPFQGPARVFHHKALMTQFGRITIRERLPAYAQVSPFDVPGERPVVMRFSNGIGLPFADRGPDVRGLAIKFFPAAGEETDILATNAPASFARDADQFLKVGEVLVEQQLAGNLGAGSEALEGVLKGRFSLFEAARIGKEVVKQTVLTRPDSLASQQYWGSVVRLGDYAVRATFVADPDAPAGTLGDKDSDNFLREDLAARLRRGGIRFTLRLLYFVDEDRTPINDASRGWDGTPVQVDVADLELTGATPQPAGEDDLNRMAFNPTHGFAGLAITRARRAIYAKSAEGRQAAAQSDYRHLFQT